jgi:WhiB family redox-sensing transcriptional regulator
MTLTSSNLPGWCNPEAVYVARDTLMEIYSLPAWSKEGLCRGYPQSMFFPTRGESAAPAKAVCRRCPVQTPCLNYALSVGPSLEGIFGGASKRDRRHLGRIISSGAG